MKTIIMMFAILVLSAGTGRAEPSADDLDDLGGRAFAARKYADALNYYRHAFQLERSAIRASQVVIASACAQEVEQALDDLWIWLKELSVLYQSDDSLKHLDNIQRAYASAVSRLHQRIAALEAETEVEHTKVRKLEDKVTGLSGRVLDLEGDLKKAQLDVLLQRRNGPQVELRRP